MKPFRLLSALVGLAAIGAVIAWIGQPASVGFRQTGDHVSTNIAIPTYNVFDIGVAAIDDDSYLDLYSINHSGMGAILLNDGSGRFEEDRDRYPFDQDAEFRRSGDTDQLPEKSVPGLYIYRHERILHIENVGDGTRGFRGSLSLPWPLTIVSADGVRTNTETVRAAPGVVSTVRFEFEGLGLLRIIGEDDIQELPHTFTIEANSPVDRIFVGLEGVTPNSTRFTIEWRDRHGVAWTDVSGDGTSDALIVRGGVRGRIGDVSTPVTDELLLGDDDFGQNHIEEIGLTKGNCPARRVELVDFDSDNLLDVFVMCGRSNDPRFPDQLYRQAPRGEFNNIASERSLDHDGVSIFRWVDVDGDSDQDLVAVADGDLVLHRNIDGDFTRETLATQMNEPFNSLLIADHDNDGDLDLFAVSPTGSRLLRNEEGTLVAVPAQNVGLPRANRAAAWTDVDLDGRLEFFSLPGGIFRFDGQSYRGTGLFEFGLSVLDIAEARCSWFDMNLDGVSDIVCAVRQAGVPRQWTIHGLRSAGEPKGNWLQVDLRGPTGNPDGIGGRVIVDNGDVIQTQQVGQSDNARFSHGHFRLHLGLGDASAANVEVIWPDGQATALTGVDPNQLLLVEWPDNTA